MFAQASACIQVAVLCLLSNAGTWLLPLTATQCTSVHAVAYSLASLQLGNPAVKVPLQQHCLHRMLKASELRWSAARLSLQQHLAIASHMVRLVALFVAHVRCTRMLTASNETPPATRRACCLATKVCSLVAYCALQQKQPHSAASSRWLLDRVVWVLKELEPENWVHNGGTDFAVQLKPPSAADVLGKVLTAEGTYTHWSLFNRFILANDILDAADSAGAAHMLIIAAALAF